MEQANCLEKQCLYLQGSWVFFNAIESAGFNDYSCKPLFSVSYMTPALPIFAPSNKPLIPVYPTYVVLSIKKDLFNFLTQDKIHNIDMNMYLYCLTFPILVIFMENFCDFRWCISLIRTWSIFIIETNRPADGYTEVCWYCYRSVCNDCRSREGV